ncbi:RDD family protein [Microbacterium aquimaris]|uniref:RDD family protein n=1 Tax=Microbacterium aquimaris TaxID=459816 RepID=UPI002AD3F817|nr:RDD family protein [Microbacterium aquimaris]MDZ8275973.1 RDD family protein [Microbacterium aquimaris]
MTEPRYPGERLGLPESGRGSIGRIGRRVGALFVDYGAAYILAGLFVTDPDGLPAVFSGDPVVIAALFVAIQVVFAPMLQGSPGHRIFGLRLVRADGAWVGLWRPIVRALLLVLVIPAVIWDSDQRGLHDKAAGTILLRA